MSCHVMPCHAMSCHVMPCHAMSCHVMPCHDMSCIMMELNTLMHDNLRNIAFRDTVVRCIAVQYIAVCSALPYHIINIVQ